MIAARHTPPPRMPKPVTAATIWTGENEQLRLQVRYHRGVPSVWLNQHRRHPDGRTEWRNVTTFPADAIFDLQTGFWEADKIILASEGTRH